jgi:hypothetical protein
MKTITDTPKRTTIAWKLRRIRNALIPVKNGWAVDLL